MDTPTRTANARAIRALRLASSSVPPLPPLDHEKKPRQGCQDGDKRKRPRFSWPGLSRAGSRSTEPRAAHGAGNPAGALATAQAGSLATAAADEKRRSSRRIERQRPNCRTPGDLARADASQMTIAPRGAERPLAGTSARSISTTDQWTAASVSSSSRRCSLGRIKAWCWSSAAGCRAIFRTVRRCRLADAPATNRGGRPADRGALAGLRTRRRPGTSSIRQNLDPAAYARETGRRWPFTVLQTDADGDGLLRHWPAPDLGAVGKHHGYAFQWFALCGLISPSFMSGSKSSSASCGGPRP